MHQICLFSNPWLLADHIYKISTDDWCPNDLKLIECWPVQNANNLKTFIFSIFSMYRVSGDLFRLDEADRLKIKILCMQQPPSEKPVFDTPPPSPRTIDIENFAEEFFQRRPQFTMECLRNKYIGLIKFGGRIVRNETFFVLVKHDVAMCEDLSIYEKEQLLSNWRGITQHVLLCNIKHSEEIHL